jgi:hypothetical protein
MRRFRAEEGDIESSCGPFSFSVRVATACVARIVFFAARLSEASAFWASEAAGWGHRDRQRKRCYVPMVHFETIDGIECCLNLGHVIANGPLHDVSTVLD